MIAIRTDQLGADRQRPQPDRNRSVTAAAGQRPGAEPSRADRPPLLLVADGDPSLKRARRRRSPEAAEGTHALSLGADKL